MFISSERAGIVKTAKIHGAPELAIAIRPGSTAERDETHQRQLYAECRVQEYWPVDPETRIITVLLLEENGYAETATNGEEQTLTSPMLEDFAAGPDEIFPIRP